ncbi:MAG: translation initiation factor IF-3 [Clostridia bacterium]|nr:translation initiation factor IF-3 [Clostridia bacterium]
MQTVVVCYFRVYHAVSPIFLRREKPIKVSNKVNEAIRHPEVRLIGADGSQLGIMSSIKAQELADAAGLDLVEIAPTAEPPVCKIMDFGKYRFETIKRQKEAMKNQKIVELKEIWLSMTIDVGDLNVKAKQALKFLAAGNKIKVSIRLRGRQNAHSSIGIEVMNKFFELVKDSAVMERKPLLEGRNILMILAPANASSKK